MESQLKPRVRRAVGRDGPRIAELTEQLGYPSSAPAVAGRLEAILASNDDTLFVAEGSNGAPVGWLHVFAAHRIGSESFAEIGGLVVAAEARRLGIGRTLVEAAQQWAEGTALTALRVRSSVAREGAHRFYTDLGFEEIKRQRVYRRRTSFGEEP